MIKIYQWQNIGQKDKYRIMRRAQADMSFIQAYVSKIIKDVKINGDSAVVKYTKKFDDSNFSAGQLRVSPEEIKKAYKAVGKKVVNTMRRQIQISSAYAQADKDNLVMDWKVKAAPGVLTGLRLTAVESVGLYVPAGKAPLPVVAQILSVPAKAAGVPRIVVCFPPTAQLSEIIVSADLAGATEIYRVGGVQAIAAMAYGTETIKPVNFISGPGNSYVQAAKLQVFGKVGIDMIAGPSEVLIMADETANPSFLAADILAQCEHGGDSAGVVVTNSQKIAEQTAKEAAKQVLKLNRQKYLKKSLEQYSGIVVVNTLADMINFSNEYAPEHLEVHLKNPRKLFNKLTNAGSIFFGAYAPVAVGDYASGTNHTLPTGGAAKYASPVGVRTFMKTGGYQYLTKKGLRTLKPIVETLSDIEGLDAHKRSVQIRFNKISSS